MNMNTVICTDICIHTCIDMKRLNTNIFMSTYMNTVTVSLIAIRAIIKNTIIYPVVITTSTTLNMIQRLTTIITGKHHKPTVVIER